MSQDHAPGTRPAILAAAIGLFAEKGYRAATVRELCARAGVNGSAVNYHFGGKEKLYGEVLRLLLQGLLAGVRLPSPGDDAPGTREEALRAFVADYCRMLYGGGRVAADLCRVFAREMVSPSPFLDALTAQCLRPATLALTDFLRPFLGPDPSEALVRDAAAFAIGTMSYFAYNNEAFRRIFPDHPGMEAAWEETAARAFAFIAGGLSRLAATKDAGEGRP